MEETMETGARDIRSHPANAWQRWEWAWPVIFYLSLLLSLLVALSASAPVPPSALALAAGIALWHGLGVGSPLRLSCERREWRPAAALHTLIEIGLWYWLVSLHPAFYFLLFGLFPHLYAFLPIWLAIGFSMALTGLLLMLQTAGSGIPLWENPFTWIYLAFTLFGVILSLWIEAIIRQSRERHAWIMRLEQAQRDLAEAERAAGQLAERQRLAREIHDTLAQGFTSIIMHLEAADQAVTGGDSAARRHIVRALESARANLQTARRVVDDLRPEVLEQLPLPYAIRRVVNQFAEESGIAAGVALTGSAEPLPPAAELTLLRAVQEALANIRKHARARRVQVTLSYMPDLVVLDVQDDGIGMGAAPPAEGNGGFGLVAMHERVAQLGGEMLLESAPGAGTTVVVQLPTGNPPPQPVSLRAV